MIDALVYSRSTLIGTTQLRDYDRSMGVIGGKFIPNENYESVRHLIWKYNDLDNEDRFVHLEEAELNVQVKDAIFLSPVAGIEICDMEELAGDGEDLEVIVMGLYHLVIDNFLDKVEPDPWVKPPWHPLTLHEKREVEARFEIELARRRKVDPGSIGVSFPAREFRFDLAPVAINRSNNMLLFDLHRFQTYLFGTVDFNADAPEFKFYRDYEDLNQNCLTPDHNDWKREHSPYNTGV